MSVAAAPAADRRRRLLDVLYDGAGLWVAVPLWVWWAAWRGAFPPTVWTPGVVYLACAAIALAVAKPIVRPRGARAAALASFTAIAVLSALSMLWAPDAGAAWAGTERIALYLLAFALPLLWPPSRAALSPALVIWPLAALIGGIAGLAGARATPTSLEAGRLLAPTGYANASAALFLMGAFPAIAVAARRERQPLVRVAMLASAGVLVSLALLTQSRGTVFGVAVALVVAFALGPNRLRLAIPFGLVALVVIVLSGELLDVRNTVLAGDAAGAIDDAIALLVTAAVALAALGTAYVLLDRRAEPGAAFVRRAARASRLALAAGVVIAIAVFLVAEGSPISWAHQRFEDFKTPSYASVENGQSRFSAGIGSNRYDYWRASVDIARDHPFSGTGAENFASAYLARRHALKAPIYAHSIWFSALSELGFPGLLLLIAFFVAVVLALVRAAPWRHALVATALLPAVYLAAHASGDFLQAFPALFVPGLGLLAAAMAPARARLRTHPRAVIAPALVAGLIGISVVPVLVASSLAARGADWPGRAQAALKDLDRAADVNPLDSQAPLQKGIVALELQRPALAQHAFETAAARDRKGWFARYEIALILAARGERAAALRMLAEVRRLNPLQSEVGFAEGAIRVGLAPDALLAARRIIAQGG